jgi:hypothetical protein
MPVFTRQAGLAARQEPYVVTQTIVQDLATYTTVVTLGTIPTDKAGADGRHDDRDTSGGGGGGGGGSGISSGQLGAIIGGVAALVLIALVICLCCSRGRSARPYDDSSHASSIIAVEVPDPRRPGGIRRPPPAAERVPGGPRYPTYRAIPIPNPRNPAVRHTR